ncbi:MAG: clan AA aspartic protease [Rubrobacteraceae bacterium]
MNASREAVVSVTVRDSRAEREIEAVVDTGFDGNLTLPPFLVADLDLPFRRRDRAILGDGSETFFDTHEATVLWDGRPRAVAVDSADTTPLLGTSLLDSHELTVRFVDGGDVRIEAI